MTNILKNTPAALRVLGANVSAHSIALLRQAPPRAFCLRAAALLSWIHPTQSFCFWITKPACFRQ